MLAPNKLIHSEYKKSLKVGIRFTGDDTMFYARYVDPDSVSLNANETRDLEQDKQNLTEMNFKVYVNYHDETIIEL